jgi:hypothetical protein
MATFFDYERESNEIDEHIIKMEKAMIKKKQIKQKQNKKIKNSFQYKEFNHGAISVRVIYKSGTDRRIVLRTIEGLYKTILDELQKDRHPKRK